MADGVRLARVERSAQHTHGPHITRGNSEPARNNARDGLGAGLDGNKHVDDPAHEKNVPWITIGESILSRHV